MTTFEDFGLNPKIINAITELNFTVPMPIQTLTIPYLLSSKDDLLGLAQTGTGKTAAFGLPILHNIDNDSRQVQCLVLTPTRELCLQITKDFINYSKYLDNIKIVSIYGGASIEKQFRELNNNPQIVVGTPGRVLDLIERRKLNINKISYLVLDEADEMLNMGFRDELDAILQTTPKNKQTLLFSATMPADLSKIANNYMHNPREITVGTRNAGVENIEHFYYLVNAKHKYLALKRIADINPDIYGIVFCRTRSETQEIANKLIEDGYNADALHGDISQAQRENIMQKFRNKLIQLLVATDVAARGIDVNNISHIINYSLPDESEVYVHRSGRTGRAGKSGTSISIIHTREKNKIKQIEKVLQQKIAYKKVPTGNEVCNKQVMNMIDKVESIETFDSQIENFMPTIYKKLSWLDREELIKRFVSVEFNRYLQYYQQAPDINVSNNEEQERLTGKRYEKGNLTFSKYFLNIGSKDKLTKARLLELINSNNSTSGCEIGRIEINAGYCIFEIDSKYDKKIISFFHNKRYAGKRLKIENK